MILVQIVTKLGCSKTDWRYEDASPSTLFFLPLLPQNF